MSDILDDDDVTIADDNSSEIDEARNDNVVVENQADFVNHIYGETRQLIVDQLSLRADEGVVFASELQTSIEKADELEFFITKDSVEVTVVSDEGTVNWNIGC